MNFIEFSALISGVSAPVILIEGRRAIPTELAASARRTSAFLAYRFPDIRFRSGNATGSDEAFSAGVLEVAPHRLQVIAPHAKHRAKYRHPLVRYDSPESLDPANPEAGGTGHAIRACRNAGVPVVLQDSWTTWQ